jgi:DNA-binding transcriptional regulator YiaG
LLSLRSNLVRSGESAPRRLAAAARLLPGRIRTMIHLAWLSGDPRVRTVARAWHSLSAVAKVETHIEELCRAAGISDGDFVGCVAGTAWEVGIGVAALCTGSPGHAVSLTSAIGNALMTGQPVEVFLSQNKWNRLRDRLRAAWASRTSDEAAALRRRSRLSQSQFASLFMTSVRTVRRWEAGLSALTTHQQFFLRLFVMYIERNGVREFRRRFVREAPRYRKAGRPAVVEHGTQPNL